MVSYQDVGKAGDPVLNARGDQVGEVVKIKDGIIGFRPTGGHPWQDPVRVVATLTDGSQKEFPLPEAMAARWTGPRRLADGGELLNE